MNASVPYDGLSYAKTLPMSPGVYRMFNTSGQLLYVGKAKNLTRRVSSYFQKQHEDPRINTMIAQVGHIEITVVPTEADALVLESRLIKSDNPKYNIALRDDRGYPYLHLSTDEDVPKLRVHHGHKGKTGRYFGPFPSSDAVHQAMDVLQKYAQLRSCTDTFFAHRSRPCLEHQIGRCSAPCVQAIAASAYKERVREVEQILDGKSDHLIRQLMHKMEEYSANLDYERAARMRDQIHALRVIQGKISVDVHADDHDVCVVAHKDSVVCAAVVNVRQGMVVGSKSFRLDPLVDIAEQEIDHEVLDTFVMQYIQSPVRSMPPTVVCVGMPSSSALPQAVATLTAQWAQPLRVLSPQTEHTAVVAIAQATVQAAVVSAQASTKMQEQRMSDLVALLDLPSTPQRVECFDISHTQGTHTVASCVVAGPSGPIKSAYRRYNITDITPGDDYAAMSQALHRRFRDKKDLPDLLLIDGGVGQVGKALEALSSLELDTIPVVGVSKGPDRKAGEETLVVGRTGECLQPGPHALGLHFIQAVRDEAHRFAITGHRARRTKQLLHSQLDDIPGIGAAKRRALLALFGSMEHIKNATTEELIKVPGINTRLAQSVYTFFHPDGHVDPSKS